MPDEKMAGAVDAPEPHPCGLEMNTPTTIPQGKTTARQELQALIFWALDNRHCSTASHIRELLLSLYNGDNKTDLSCVQLLDNHQRRSLASIIIGIGRDRGFYDYEIRDTFAIAGGEAGLRWFFHPTGGIEDVLLRNFMASAERNNRKAVAA